MWISCICPLENSLSPISKSLQSSTLKPRHARHARGEPTRGFESSASVRRDWLHGPWTTGSDNASSLKGHQRAFDTRGNPAVSAVLAVPLCAAWPALQS